MCCTHQKIARLVAVLCCIVAISEQRLHAMHVAAPNAAEGGDWMEIIPEEPEQWTDVVIAPPQALENAAHDPTHFAEPARAESQEAAVVLEQVAQQSVAARSVCKRALVNAARAGNLEAVVQLLQQGADVNWCKRPQSFTALHHAAQKGYEQIARVLLAHGARVDARGGQYMSTPLRVAARLGHTGVVAALLEAGADTGVTDIHGHWALTPASFNGHQDVVAQLLEHAGDQTDLPGGCNALFYSAQEGHLEVARLLLGHGISPNQLEMQSGETPLIRAIINGHDEVIALLLSADNADLTLADRKGLTALHYAAFKGHNSFVRRLLQQGANPNTQTKRDKNTPLMLAARQGHINVLDALVEHGAGLSLQSRNGYTALSNAVYKGQRKAAIALLGHGANVKQQFYNGNNALIEAADRNDGPILVQLITAGADAAHRNHAGQTALTVAAGKGSEVAVLLLFDHPWTRDACDQQIGKALVKAAQRGHAAVVSRLLARLLQVIRLEQADLRMSLGSAVREAASAGHEEIVGHLLEFLVRTQRAGVVPAQALFNASMHGHAGVVAKLLDCALNDQPAVAVDVQDLYGNTPLLYAARRGHHAVADCLLRHGAQKKHCNVFGRNALMEASRNGSTAVIERLVAPGGQEQMLNDIDSGGHSALADAIAQGHEDCAVALIEAGATFRKAVPNHYAAGERARHWYTELVGAARGGLTEVVKLLLERGADVEQVSKCQRPLQVAAEKGHLATVNCLLQHGAQVNAQGIGPTALHYAAGKGHNGVVARLLAAGANTEAGCAMKSTPLIHAAGNNGTLITIMLLGAHGADLNAQDRDESTALLRAARAGSWRSKSDSEAIVRYLLTHGAGILSRRQHFGLIDKHKHRAKEWYTGVQQELNAVCPELREEQLDTKILSMITKPEYHLLPPTAE